MAIGGRPTAPQHRVGAHRWIALEQVPMKGAAPYAARRTPEVGVCKRASCATLSHGSISGLTVSRDFICVPGLGFNITSLHLGTTVLRDWPRHLKGALEEARLTVRSYQDLLIAAAHEMRTPLHAIGLHLEVLRRLLSHTSDRALINQIELAKRVLDGYVRRTSTLLDVGR